MAARREHWLPYIQKLEQSHGLRAPLSIHKGVSPHVSSESDNGSRIDRPIRPSRKTGQADVMGAGVRVFTAKWSTKEGERKWTTGPNDQASHILSLAVS